MTVLEILLILATLLCAITAGFVFAYATVIMPGIALLDDKAFIRAFQVTDGIIQEGQPLFGLVWIGSAVALLAVAGMAVVQLDGIERSLIVAATLCYMFGVQLTTFAINVPLNNQLQSLDVSAIDDAQAAAARGEFESRWVRWNTIRTFNASLVSAALMLVLLRL